MLQHLTGWTPWAESAPPHPVSGRRMVIIDREGRGANWMPRSDWRQGAVVRAVQGHTPVHSWAIWLNWRRYEYHRHCAGPSDQGHFREQLTITYAHRRFWQIYWPPACWYGGAYYT